MTHICENYVSPIETKFWAPLVAQKKKKSTKKKCRGDIVCENPNNFNLKTPQNIT
jgi:hypothetical protein